MDDVAAITHHLEYLFLKKIISGLRDNSIAVAQTKQYCNEFLQIEPFKSVEDAHSKIAQFIATHPAFENLMDYVQIYEKEAGVAGKINRMREHIRQNNIDAAIAVARE